MSKITLWSQKIANHFWYCCCTCNGDLATLNVVFTVYNEHYSNAPISLLTSGEVYFTMFVITTNGTKVSVSMMPSQNHQQTPMVSIFHTLFKEMQVSNCSKKYLPTKGG